MVAMVAMVAMAANFNNAMPKTTNKTTRQIAHAVFFSALIAHHGLAVHGYKLHRLVLRGLSQDIDFFSMSFGKPRHSCLTHGLDADKRKTHQFAAE